VSFTIFTASVQKILDYTSYVNLGVSIVSELHIVLYVRSLLKRSQQSVFQYEMSALFSLS